MSHRHGTSPSAAGRSALGALVILMGLTLLATPSRARPYIWDQDGDRVDDRAETVNLLGYSFSFEGADTTARQRIEVRRTEGGLVYGVHVIYAQPVTTDDLLALGLLAMPVLHRIEAVPAVRSLATFAQIQAAASLPGVERVEAVPVLQPLLDTSVAAIAARDESQRVFPTWTGTGGPEGEGVVIAFLDTGINDQPEGAWPGHEALAGRFLGGATFVAGDSVLDTPRDGSVNPWDGGGSVTAGHATHVAGIALGSGGPSGFARGVAPQARFVDVKVLNDAGFGTGLPEALDWCIHNAQRDWGAAGTTGIDVINLSLSSPDSSDGNDLASRLAAAAAERGIVVVASMGNDGAPGRVPSPAAGDGVLAVGAFDSQRTGEDGDDVFASFSNQGPRADDGDLDALDELKPDLIAPGVAVLSADGNPSTDGHQYRRQSGTSMAAAMVSGAVACLRSAYPTLAPAAIAGLLRATAWHGTAGLPGGPAGADPRWQAARGFGALDLYAAKREADAAGGSQVVRLALTAAGDEIGVDLRTQREMGAAFFAIERAPDVAGVPGVFADHDSVAATGDGDLGDASNREVYTRLWSVPPSELGAPFWYRAAWTEDGVRSVTPARRVVSPSGTSAATLEVTIAHNAYDEDVDASIEVGAPGAPPDWTVSLPGSVGAVSSDWVPGASVTGNVALTFRLEVPAGAVDGRLPPSPSAPWRLRVTEGGFLNRSGRIVDFRLIHHLAGGDVVHPGGPVPMQTIEGHTVIVSLPGGAVGVGPATEAPGGLRAAPNPARPRDAVHFVCASSVATEVEVFDVGGRRVARVPLSTTAGGGRRGTWSLQDLRGSRVRPGVYLARALGSAVLRMVVLPD